MTDGGAVDLDGACRALDAGRAVVLPNPAPLTRVVTGTRPDTVNTAKARPADQPVALWAHHDDTWDTLVPSLDLDGDLVAFARRLLTDDLLTLLLPLRPDVPAWLAPASKDGWALLFGARWSPLRPLLDRFPLLYVSSANTTGHPPAATTAEATTMFAPTTPVLDTTFLPDHTTDVPRQATTTVRLHPGGVLDLHRHGAQDHPHPNAAAYLDTLHRAAKNTGTAAQGDAFA
ncbi:hypothetical protein [Umezawaea tangerina]|uniref:tRNA A37 threonylcarbamoyladenosine synthetase subunit TsaC/SUA5/YrdC n=1 Tax=Umezawaea tangerina TaxID=84725 RepID=A0A2T0TH10_9PSEU|nr:hypothetical protein [Umezawaea tangerina]PRY44901.1 hypothetical protein CLV43_102466 [Umezawaea tangerina]